MNRYFGVVCVGLILTGIFLLSLTTPFVSQATSNGFGSFGLPFPVAESPVRQEKNPSMAYDQSRMYYLVAYEDGSEINAVCFNHLEEIQSSYPLGSGQNPDVAFNIWADQYLVVWEHENEIEGSFVSGSCTPGEGSISHIPDPISADYTGYKAAPAVAYNHHEFHQDYLVVWSSSTDLSSNWSVYYRRVTSTGPSTVGSFPVKKSATAFYYDPDIAYNLSLNEYLIVYVRDASKGQDPQALDVYGRRGYNTGGTGWDPEVAIDSSTGSQDQPAVTANRLNSNNPYLVVYRNNSNDTTGDVSGYLFNIDGTPQTHIDIATEFGESEREPAVASSGTHAGYVAAWMLDKDSSPEIYLRHLSSTGDPGYTRLVSTLPGAARQPALAEGPQIPALVWQQDDASGWDIYARFMIERIFFPLTLR